MTHCQSHPLSLLLGGGKTLFWRWGIMGSIEGRMLLLLHLPFYKEQKQDHVANHNLKKVGILTTNTS